MRNSENKDWYLVKRIPELENNKKMIQLFFGGVLMYLGGFFLMYLILDGLLTFNHVANDIAPYLRDLAK